MQSYPLDCCPYTQEFVFPFGHRLFPRRAVDIAVMARRARHRLPLSLRFNGLVDLPEGAFGIGKVRRA